MLPASYERAAFLLALTWVRPLVLLWGRLPAACVLEALVMHSGLPSNCCSATLLLAYSCAALSGAWVLRACCLRAA
jgi:hypothetical protein